MQARADVNAVQRRLRLVIASLIVISTVVFVAGVTIEHGRGASEAQTTHRETIGEQTIATATPQQAGEASEGQGGAEGSGESAETHKEASEGSQAQEGTEAHKETVLG